MASKRFANDGNSVSKRSSVKKTWFLIQWTGSTPVDYDIINASDIVCDEFCRYEDLRIGHSIMVYCHRIKCLASIVYISEDTEVLHKKLLELREESKKEEILAKTEEMSRMVKRKRRTTLKEEICDEKTYEDKETQTSQESTVLNLLEENRKLKAELNDSKKILKAFCTNIKLLAENTDERIKAQELNLDEETGYSSSRSTSSSSPPRDDKCLVTEHKNKILIGRGQTEIDRFLFNQVNWLSYSAATRKLLMAVFPREVLATHSLTGKPSPAFLTCDMPEKKRLDPKKVSDIIEVVCAKCRVSESVVRATITTKCADENKMYRKRQETKCKYEK